MVNKENKELCKLLYFAYYMNQEKFKKSYPYASVRSSYCNNNKRYSGEYKGNKLISGRCFIGDHSSYSKIMELGVFTCEKNRNRFNLEDKFKEGYICQFYDYTNYVGIQKVIPVSSEKNDMERADDFSWSNRYDSIDNEFLSFFSDFIANFGFRKEDILDVLNEKMTAREAYMNVAPEDIKNYQWINEGINEIIFDNNVAISGDFTCKHLDRFEFPFEGEIIFDCSKVKINGMYTKDCNRKIKLINVNENINSIKHTNLENMIIEEEIDLSKVDATGVNFGKHKVINAEYSIANLKEVDLSLATDENGYKYVSVYANADDQKMSQNAYDNGADAIGLIRTENIFQSADDIKCMMEYILGNHDERALDILKKLQAKQINDIYKINYKYDLYDFTFRLLDFKFEEYLRRFDIDFKTCEKNIKKLRGAHLLNRNKELLKVQIETIFKNVEVSSTKILVPMITNIKDFKEIKDEIKKIDDEKFGYFSDTQIGAMIENKEMANEADKLADEADFICFGMGDLTASIKNISRPDILEDYIVIDDEVKNVITNAIKKIRAKHPNLVIGVCGEQCNYIGNMPFFKKCGVNYITCTSQFIQANKCALMNSSESTSRKSRKL